jgi:hypothetical protein
VRFAPGGGFAFVPGVVLVREPFREQAGTVLAETFDIEPRGELLLERWVEFAGIPDPLAAIGALRRAGIVAQVDHVLFATCCCPPHPADPAAAPFYANPFYANAIGANPFYANPFYANPFYANPFYANAAGRGCGCGCSGGGVWGSPFYANPFYANATPSPFLAADAQETGRRRSSARPAQDIPGGVEYPVNPNGVRIAVLDTGYADSFTPTGLSPILGRADGDAPSEDGDNYLDPAAGHGTFITGVIEQLVPGCQFDVIEVLTTYGDGKESQIATALQGLLASPPHFVNLSFGAYSPLGMEVLRDAIEDLQKAGTVVVASAGNDGTCAPLYPAAFDGVIGVGALVQDEGVAAPFTNYGPWVDACTAGVDLTSVFFEGWNGDEPPVDGADPDEFEGWAVWSGTSFAAPRVVAALASQVAAGSTPRQAVKDLILDPKKERRPMLGTVVVP